MIEQCEWRPLVVGDLGLPDDTRLRINGNVCSVRPPRGATLSDDIAFLLAVQAVGWKVEVFV